MIETLIFKVAEGIYRHYNNELEKSNYREHLPPHIIMLFQDFKRAYDSKNINKLSNRLSDNFIWNIYQRKNKSKFLQLMKTVFNSLKYGLNPCLTIQVDHILFKENNQFIAIIEMDAKVRLLNITLPITYDQGKLLCEAKPEGELKYWRLTKIELFNE